MFDGVISSVVLYNTRKNCPKTKIVCTLGPVTESEDMICALVESGMSVARLNLSHGDLDTHGIAVKRVRNVSKRLRVPVAVMVDVPGPKYRTGPISSGAIELKYGDKFTLTSRDIVGNDKIVGVSPPGIHRDAVVGDAVLLDDGLLELRVNHINVSDIRCEVVVGGRLTERRGVATPGKAPSQVFPDARAKSALKFAADQDVDFVALSTIKDAADVEKARVILRKSSCNAHIISKIERSEALKNFDSILEASDGIMVARGDMAVDVPLARVPLIQKDIISRSNAAGKPVITATQMLESMVKTPVPTRAEVTDVANAVFDGTDAIMLSGETSVGQNPVQAVRVMAEVAMETESALPYGAMISDKALVVGSQTDDAISYDACRTAYQINAKLIVAFTESGGTAGRVSKYRPMAPILALTHDTKVQRKLVLCWGVTPVIVKLLSNVEGFFEEGESQARSYANLTSGSLIVLVAGLPIGVPGGTNLLRVMAVS